MTVTIIIEGSMGNTGHDWEACILDKESGVVLLNAYGINPASALNDLMAGAVDIFFQQKIKERNSK